MNRLIDGLPRADRRRILDACETVDLAFGAIVCEAGQPLQHVYFPLTAFISLRATVTGHPPLEMGLIGNEGMLGVTLALGVTVAPLRGVVQGAGTALRLTAPQLQLELENSLRLQRTLDLYLYVLLAQLSQTSACTRFHVVEARLARWLLMTHDRAHADHFYLTHQLLADMLGVQRSAVTIAAGAMQARKLIHYTRGEIRVLDRAGLEAVSCECYDLVIEDYARLLA